MSSALATSSPPTIERLREQSLSLRDRVVQLQTQETMVKQRIEDDTTKIAELEESGKSLHRQRELTQLTAAAARKIAVEKFARVVTTAMKTIIQDGSEFVINLGSSRNITVASFRIKIMIKGVELEVDPLEAKGGGIADLCAIGLQIAAMEVFRQEGPLLLDEPFKHLSALGGYRDRTSSFLRQVSEQLDRQIILITHASELSGATHKLIRIIKEEGEAKIEQTDE